MSASKSQSLSWANEPVPDSPRVLYISGLFVPRGDAETFCSANFAVALANCGANLTVVTCPDYLRRNLDASKLWGLIENKVVNVPLPKSSDRIQSLRMAIRYRSWVYARWIGAAIEEAKYLHQKNPFDLVYSRSLPMFSHVVGYWSSKELKLPWIATINDPWDWHHFPIGALGPPVFPRANVSDFWMRKTIRSADVVSYPSTRLHAFHSKLSGVDHEALIIPHVGSGFLAEPSLTTDRLRKFELIHTSALKCDRTTGRSTKTLLGGLQMFLQDFPAAKEWTQLTLVGPEDAESQAWASSLGLRDIVRWTGRLAYEDSLKHIQAAAVGVLVEAEMKEGIFLPSKLVDYLSARKPVLALSPQVGVVNDLAENGGITRVNTGDLEAVRRALGSFYADFKNDTLGRRAPSPEQINQFNPEMLARKFLTAFYHLELSEKSRRESRSSNEIQAEATTNTHAK